MPPPFLLSYYDPPSEIADHILTLFHFRSDLSRIVDRLPGAVGQLVIFARGGGTAELPSGSQWVGRGAHLLSGFSRAAPIAVDGPWVAFGVSLSPLGWASLTGEPAADHFDRFVPAERFFGEEASHFANDLVARYIADRVTEREAAEEVSEWAAKRLGPVPEGHQRLIDATQRWLGTSLNPALGELFVELAYSRRQAERLVERYFGLPPAALARKYRAIRAAAMLAQVDLTDHAEALIAEAFYDQPHMVREIRRFCGRTPSRLGGEDDPLMQIMLQMKNFRRLHLLDGLG